MKLWHCSSRRPPYALRSNLWKDCSDNADRSAYPVGHHWYLVGLISWWTTRWLCGPMGKADVSWEDPDPQPPGKRGRKPRHGRTWIQATLLTAETSARERLTLYGNREFLRNYSQYRLLRFTAPACGSRKPRRNRWEHGIPSHATA
jgi:hypothetical protein